MREVLESYHRLGCGSLIEAVSLAGSMGDLLAQSVLSELMIENQGEDPEFSAEMERFKDLSQSFARSMSTGRSMEALSLIQKMRDVRARARDLIDGGVSDRVSLWGMEWIDSQMAELDSQASSVKQSFRDRSTARALRDVQPMSDSEYFKFALQAERQVDEDEQHGLRLYSHGHYEHINPALRSAATKVTNRYGDDVTHQQRYVKSMELGIEKVSLPRDVKVFRVVQDTPDGMFRSLSPGDIFSDRGFVSTTSNRSILDRFYQGRPESRVDLEIILRRGSKGFPVSQFSKYKDEREILLGTNQRMKITGTSSSGGRTVVQAERI